MCVCVCQGLPHACPTEQEEPAFGQNKEECVFWTRKQDTINASPLSCLIFSLLPGLPKAARISHLKSIMCLGFYSLVGATSSDVIYVTLPLYHMSGSLLGVVGTMGIGMSGACL